MKSKKTIIISTVIVAGSLIGATTYASMDDSWRGSFDGNRQKPFDQQIGEGHKGPFMDMNNKRMYRRPGIEEVLGIEREELKDLIKEGKTMAEIIETAGFTEESFREALALQREEKSAEHLAELVENGEITQEEADRRMELKQEREEWRGEKHKLMQENHADLLGMTIEELEAKLDGGDKIRDIIEGSGLEVDEFREDMHEEMVKIEESHLQELINNGTLTQEEADDILERIENHKPGDRMRGGKKGFGKREMQGMHRGQGGQMGMFQN